MLSKLRAGGLPELQCDVAIVGAGAAGITLALALSDRGLKVVVLESGGLDFDQDVQARYQGRVAGRDYFDLESCRLRYLGGSTNHWGGQCARLDERDFAARDWIPDSGWPIGSAAIEPHLAEAQRILDIGEGGFDPGELGAPLRRRVRQAGRGHRGRSRDDRPSSTAEDVRPFRSVGKCDTAYRCDVRERAGRIDP